MNTIYTIEKVTSNGVPVIPAYKQILDYKKLMHAIISNQISFLFPPMIIQTESYFIFKHNEFSYCKIKDGEQALSYLKLFHMVKEFTRFAIKPKEKVKYRFRVDPIPETGKKEFTKNRYLIHSHQGNRHETKQVPRSNWHNHSWKKNTKARKSWGKHGKRDFKKNRWALLDEYKNFLKVEEEEMENFISFYKEF